MDTRADSKAAQLFLPLATGLLIVGLHAAVRAGGAGLLGLLVLLTLGAVVPGPAWRTGALAAAPLILAGVVTTAGESLGTVVLVVAGSPVLVAAFAAAVKGGSILVAQSAGQRAGAGSR